MTKTSKTTTGHNMWLYTPVAVGDHPKSMSHQQCSVFFDSFEYTVHFFCIMVHTDPRILSVFF